MLNLFKKNILCPYCNQPLEKVPKRKSKCPHCNQPIYVRKGKLFTEENAEILDWLVRLESYGLTNKRFNTEREMLTKRFKTKASVNDTIWSFLNSWVGEHPISQETKRGYYEMARLVSIEGKDAKSYIEQALRSQLLYYKKQGEKYVRIVAYGGHPNAANTCSECAKLHGEKIKIDEAINKMPIPRNCTAEDGCKCSYELIDLLESI